MNTYLFELNYTPKNWERCDEISNYTWKHSNFSFLFSLNRDANNNNYSIQPAERVRHQHGVTVNKLCKVLASTYAGRTLISLNDQPLDLFAHPTEEAGTRWFLMCTTAASYFTISYTVTTHSHAAGFSFENSCGDTNALSLSVTIDVRWSRTHELRANPKKHFRNCGEVSQHCISPLGNIRTNVPTFQRNFLALVFAFMDELGAYKIIKEEEESVETEREKQ